MKNNDRLNVSTWLLFSIFNNRLTVLFFIPFFFLLSQTNLLNAQTFIGLSAGADLYDQVDFRSAVVIEWPKNELYSWQTELIYVKRENVSLLQLLPQNENHIRPVISYVEVPFLFKIKLNLQGAKLFAVVGPKIGYALAAYSTLWKENGQLVKQQIRLEDIEVAGWDIGMNLGVGLEKDISKGKKIFVEFRYYLGVKDLFPQGEAEIYNEGKSFNMGFLIPVKME